VLPSSSVLDVTRTVRLPLAVYVLAVGTFLMGTSEFAAKVGVLDQGPVLLPPHDAVPVLHDHEEPAVR
jgi:hypothetical protein